MPTSRRPLIVRLRNWVGDVTLGLPTLQRLADSGYDLRLVGKRWAQDLLAGHGWAVAALPSTLAQRVHQLRQMRREARSVDPTFDRRLNAVCFPYSFSSALEFRLAGLKAIGHAYEGRGLLLARSVARPKGLHELAVYWHLGSALLGGPGEPPAVIGLRLAPEHRRQALALRERHAIPPGYIVICPFAGGTWSGVDKTWPAFAEFAHRELPIFGRRVLICPGPGEETAARDGFPDAVLLDDVGLGAYAALLAESALMISNDTGPGHLAAAVGAPLISVLGPSDPLLWRAWGPSVEILQGADGWPAITQVRDAAARRLAPCR